MIQRLIDNILEYNPNADVDLILKAYHLARDHHKGQLRNSGEEYIIHPLNVSLILAEMNMDTATIIAGLLHDVIEDTDVTYDDVKEDFGEEIADLVDGVTKLKKLNYQTKQEKQAENIRKMVLAMAKDIRVVIVKFADRLHNMRTLEYMRDEKKKEKALETIEIYAPLADRLGISKVKWELEDLSLRYLDPENYYMLIDMVNKRRNEREALINNIIDSISKQLKKMGVSADIHGRPKNFYSIYKKMMYKGKSFDEIYDLSAVRIIVDDIKDCYGALGVVHTMYKPIPGRFKDYISMPKPNKYQSLHTTVIDGSGETFEVQIRTWDMHKTAEYGIAAHWKYKEGVNKSTSFDENLTWLRQLLEWQKDLKDPNEFMETLKVDFFADEVFVFTPRGDVINLPDGSTPIDFAYRVHSAVGNTCVGAKVNGRIVPLNFKLQNGNIIEVITNKNSGPSLDWLNIVQSPQAKTKIRQYFKVKDRDKNVLRGKEAIDQEAKRLGYPPHILVRDQWMEEIRERLKVPSMDDLYAAIGYGSMTVNQVTAKLVDYIQQENKEKEKEISLEKDIAIGKKKVKSTSSNGIVVKGIDNVKVRTAKCCNPVPGDSIIGYITMGRGISVHRSDCVNIINEKEDSRLIEVSWDISEKDSYHAEIEVRAADKGNVLGDIANRINDSRLGLINLSARANKDHTLVIRSVIQIHDISDLEYLLNKIRKIENVYDAYRVKS
ncbi:bifunctional (p)ppGpp synthetase/guanosine-3',5'-bis(diphosphate) 3'-pyrophosphohydrolase [Peptoniphilus sp. KCTC 25270]|uniref:RelA/SpoT family protein n=1 Tax=Peptoniphilus sp. KCTC 25270 TaxID=2897414 RepID=UPI001E63B2C3|nr:bifunctional (p)ppGpp synthetase/guanosine-3',5'-bis(diphosphate) 3'-pyrophosphohydrolase [Peptoniphilus sp. KCTC 25270]MCD1147038.1 bifunctional (p)ppGpp synthetase/guanosine-3',5'-bis(diphosphate) 3'-pyrophosphohydrolase [Peptoniphilus sp. KCTC 25270]